MDAKLTVQRSFLRDKLETRQPAFCDFCCFKVVEAVLMCWPGKKRGGGDTEVYHKKHCEIEKWLIVHIWCWTAWWMSGQLKYLTGKKNQYTSLHVTALVCEQGKQKNKPEPNLKILCLVYFYLLCSRTDSAASTRNTFTKLLVQKSLPLSFFINYKCWTRNFWKHEDVHLYAHNLENC